MILLHRFKERVSDSESIRAGTATFTRARSESNDQDPSILAGTKSATAVRGEMTDPDLSPMSGRVFPWRCDSDSH